MSVRSAGGARTAASAVFILVPLAVGYFLGGSDPQTRSVLGLGTAQRNIAAALVIATRNLLDLKVVAMLLVATFIWKKYTPGDLNCDGRIDGADVAPFVVALLDATQFANQYPGCDILAGDLDGDGIPSTGDIPLFVQLLLVN